MLGCLLAVLFALCLSWVSVLIGMLGSVIGTSLWYVLGAWIGAPRLKRWAARHGRWLTLAPSDIDRAQEWFDRHGGMAVLIGRMVPVVRTLISVPAGGALMPWHRFLGYTAAGSLIWTLLLTGAGLLLEANYHRVSDVIDPLSTLVVAVVVLVYLYRVITWKPH